MRKSFERVKHKELVIDAERRAKKKICTLVRKTFRTQESNLHLLVQLVMIEIKKLRPPDPMNELIHDKLLASEKLYPTGTNIVTH